MLFLQIQESDYSSPSSLILQLGWDTSGHCNGIKYALQVVEM